MSAARCCSGGRRWRGALLHAWQELLRRPLLRRAAAPGPQHRCRLRHRGRRAGGRVQGCRWWPPTTCASSREADYDAHEARVCIRERALLADAGPPRRYTREQFLRTPAQMAAAVRRYSRGAAQQRGDRPALHAAAEAGRQPLPVFPVPDGIAVPRTGSANPPSRDWRRGTHCARRLGPTAAGRRNTRRD